MFMDTIKWVAKRESKLPYGRLKSEAFHLPICFVPVSVSCLSFACTNHNQSLRHLPVDFTPTVGCHSEEGPYLDISLGIGTTSLVEWIGSSTPVGEEETETNRLKETRQNANGNSVDRPVLGNEGRDELERDKMFSN